MNETHRTVWPRGNTVLSNGKIFVTDGRCWIEVVSTNLPGDEIVYTTAKPVLVLQPWEKLSFEEARRLLIKDMFG